MIKQNWCIGVLLILSSSLLFCGKGQISNTGKSKLNAIVGSKKAGLVIHDVRPISDGLLAQMRIASPGDNFCFGVATSTEENLTGYAIWKPSGRYHKKCVTGRLTDKNNYEFLKIDITSRNDGTTWLYKEENGSRYYVGRIFVGLDSLCTGWTDSFRKIEYTYDCTLDLSNGVKITKNKRRIY